MPIVRTEVVANILGFCVIFCGILLVGALIAAFLSRLFRWIGLSWFNHLLGGIAGAIRGALVIAVLVDILVAFSPSPTPQFISNSYFLPYTTEISAWLVELAPRELKDTFIQQMENLRRFRNHSAQDSSQGVTAKIGRGQILC